MTTNTAMNAHIYDMIRGCRELAAETISILSSLPSETPAAKVQETMFDVILARANSNAAAMAISRVIKVSKRASQSKPLFESRVHKIIDYKIAGKKQTPSDLIVRGEPSLLGSERIVTAMADGVVLYAGRSRNCYSRASRNGLHVIIRHDDCVNVTYALLGSRFVQEGDQVRAGEVIGEVDPLRGAVKIDVRRNGRRINAAEWMGVELREGRRG